MIGLPLDERLLKRIVNCHSSFIKLDLLSAHQFDFSLLSPLLLSEITKPTMMDSKAHLWRRTNRVLITVAMDLYDIANGSSQNTILYPLSGTTSQTLLRIGQ